MTTMGQPKSALEISRDSGIPITTAYRRIKDLISVGLLEVAQSGRSPDGHWFELYRSIIKNVEIKFHQEALDVDVSLRDDASDRLTRMWSAVRKR